LAASCNGTGRVQYRDGVSAPPPGGVQRHDQAARRRQFADAAVDRQWRRDVAEHEVQSERLAVEVARHAGHRRQRRQLRCEGEAAVRDGPVERLLAEAVACQDKPRTGAVVEAEGEHAAQTLRHGVAALAIERQEDFGVAVIAEEPASASFQFSPQVAMVVDFAVEDDGPPRMVRIGHGLASAGWVEHGQPRVGQAARWPFGVDPRPLLVGTAMGHGGGHASQQADVNR